MAQLAIKGHSTRGKEVIEILEMLGGKNVTNYDGRNTKSFYFINNIIICSSYGSGKLLGIDCYTLEQFLEKFPYKVGDKAFAFGNKCTIIDAVWDGGIDEVVYTIKLDTSKYTTTKLSNQLQPYKEKTMDKANKAAFDANAQCCDIMNHLIKEETMGKEEETFGECIEKTIQECLFGKKETMEDIIKIDIPKGYEFAGVDDDKQQVVFTKIQLEYPNTYEECCEIMGIEYPVVGGKPDGLSASTYRITEIRPFIYLLICRDAYWKIAGWNPKVKSDVFYMHTLPSYLRDLFPMPTEEMRDAFYENFKDLIEQCKELL